MKRLSPPFDSYAVDEEGNVWSQNKKWRNTFGDRWRPLRPRKRNRSAHLQVILCLSARERKAFLVHRLVLETFIGPCPSGLECRHLNGDPTDNRLANLVWGTKLDNTVDYILHNHKKKNPNSNLLRSTIRARTASQQERERAKVLRSTRKQWALSD